MLLLSDTRPMIIHDLPKELLPTLKSNQSMQMHGKNELQQSLFSSHQILDQYDSKSHLLYKSIYNILPN